MPDPDSPGAAKLYSLEFYGPAVWHLAPQGRMVVHEAALPRSRSART